MIVVRYASVKHSLILQVFDSHLCKKPNEDILIMLNSSMCLPFRATLPARCSAQIPSWATGCLCFVCHIISFSFSDEQNFVLRDAEAEVLFCFSLEESLKRAQVAPLFKVCNLP